MTYQLQPKKNNITMKRYYLLAIVAFLSMSMNAQKRCVRETDFGRCTNEAVSLDTLCQYHEERKKSTLLPQTTRCQFKTKWGRCTNEVLVDSLCGDHWSSLVTTSKVKKSSSTYPTRCKAITQKGRQCSRNAQKGSSYCWQHSR